LRSADKDARDADCQKDAATRLMLVRASHLLKSTAPQMRSEVRRLLDLMSWLLEGGVSIVLCNLLIFKNYTLHQSMIEKTLAP